MGGLAACSWLRNPDQQNMRFRKSNVTKVPNHNRQPWTAPTLRRLPAKNALGGTFRCGEGTNTHSKTNFCSGT